MNQILSTVELDLNDNISVKDAEKLLLRLNSKLGKKYGVQEANEFFNKITILSKGKINFEEFKNLFLKLNS